LNSLFKWTNYNKCIEKYIENVCKWIEEYIKKENVFCTSLEDIKYACLLFLNTYIMHT